MKSILIGNGINIQFANSAYSSDFIVKRAYFNSLQGKYDSLFENKISGPEIANVIKEFICIGNDILGDKFSYLTEANLKKAIDDFRCRYKLQKKFAKYSEIMLEDWFLLIRLFFVEHADISEQWLSAKQGFEQIFLDSIFNDGYIEKIFLNMPKKVKKFFKSFDNIFSLNYDSNIEALTQKEVFHLHGCFNTLGDGENPETVYGYMNLLNGKLPDIFDDTKHCFCNALLDYSGLLKEKRVVQIDMLEAEISRLRLLNILNRYEYDDYLTKLKEHDEKSFEYIKMCIEKPNLSAGTDYHFNSLRELTGELIILGMSPNNDEHIFECINKSQIEKVIFYNYGSLDITLPIDKPYKVLDVSDLWDELDAKKKVYNCKISLPNNPKVEDFYKVFDSMSLDPEPIDMGKRELEKIPQFEVKRLCSLSKDLLKKQKLDGPPKDEQDLLIQFSKMSSIALREGILPKALYLLTIMNFDKY